MPAIPAIGLVTVIGLGIWLFILLLQQWQKFQDRKQQKENQIDTEIDKADSLDDFLHIDDQLLDK